ncbi:MAG: flagellar hook-basal body complex protein FliE [Acidaminobacter sp.]|uniref:flagellar hook-basal body complex protein FliE n=1 Tax=Acidaminobacter sp. TaxID=1872102 RepID=UPI00137FB13D|nr:flagellar hook-basal body complex protein FliE [Acidaminobacter sp.]MZQ99730.1 flagellar hook-basal body complex protein FliE [Acidaminobacter sp.]
MAINPVLTQMMPLNNLVSQSSGINSGAGEAGTVNFGDMLKTQLEKVENAQIRADGLTQQLVSGDSVELHEVLIATQEAKLMLEMTMQVRNKVVEAYKEMMTMQL